MIQNRQCRALSLDARNVAIWTKSGEKIYLYYGLRAVGNSLTTWAISLHRSYEILVPLALTIKRWRLNTTRKSNVVHQLSYGVEFTGVNTSALILGTFRESEKNDAGAGCQKFHGASCRKLCVCVYARARVCECVLQPHSRIHHTSPETMHLYIYVKRKCLSFL